MPGLYGPPPPRKRAAAAPDPPARPDSPGVALLRWLGTFALLIAAMTLWIWAEMRQPNEQLQQLERIQLQLRHLSQPMPRFDVPLPPIEPLQTAEIIPSGAIVPAERQPAQVAPTPALQTAEIIPPR